MVVLDTTVLLLLFDAHAAPPLDPTTNALLTGSRERVERLLQTLRETKAVALIPTPVLCELLVQAPNRDLLLSLIGKMPLFEVQSFDIDAAVEASVLIHAGMRSTRQEQEAKTKVKFDSQILAIAKINGATAIYTDDQGLARKAAKNGITAIGTHQIPLPPQGELSLD